MTDPAVTPDGIAQGLEELRPIGVSKEDLVTGVTAADLGEAGIFLPRRSGRTVAPPVTQWGP